LLDEHRTSRLESGDGCVGEDPGRNRQESRSGELGSRGKRKGGGADWEVKVKLVLVRGMLGIGQGRVEDLDDLVARQVFRIIVNKHGRGQWVGFVGVDTEHTHQLALDRLAKVALAVQQWILEP